MFLDYGGDKEFGVKGYVDVSFNTDPDDSKWSLHYTYPVCYSESSGLESKFAST